VNGSERFARWRELDTHDTVAGQRMCWLDRKTGGLLYLVPGLDPNIASESDLPLTPHTAAEKGSSFLSNR
jgi:hypothetical protein